MSNPCSFHTPPLEKAYRPLTPLTSGEEKCAPEHHWGPGARAQYLIHYVIAGKGVFYCGPHKYELQKGQVFVIFPGTIVKYQADKRDPWHYTWVSFYGDESTFILSQAGITPLSPVLTLQNGEEVPEILRGMPRERGADMRENLRFSARLYDFLSLLMPSGTGEQKRENVYFTAATRYIKAHYAEDITVENVATQIGISRKYLFAIFKNASECSPKDYIIEYRMKRAKEFLGNPDLSIGNIAYSVGYKDPLTFSKIFKKKVGQSPRAYRDTASVRTVK